MRHRKKKVTLDRKRGPRDALVRSLVYGLVTHGYITTTKARAKVLVSTIERLITLGKKPSLHVRRQLIMHTGSPVLAEKIMNTVAPKMSARSGGYVRTYQLSTRKGDRSPMTKVEFIES